MKNWDEKQRAVLSQNQPWWPTFYVMESQTPLGASDLRSYNLPASSSISQISSRPSIVDTPSNAEEDRYKKTRTWDENEWKVLTIVDLTDGLEISLLLHLHREKTTRDERYHS